MAKQLHCSPSCCIDNVEGATRDNDAMSSSPSRPAALRYRHNTIRTRTTDDAVDSRPERRSSSTTGMAKDYDCSHLNKSGSKNINRERVKRLGTSSKRKSPLYRKKDAKNEDETLRCLMSVATILFVLLLGGLGVIGGLIYLQQTETSLENDAFHVNREEDDNVAKASEAGDSFQSNHEDILSPPKPSLTYSIPNSMPHVGDKSEEYARLRKAYDENYPPNSPERSLQAVKELLANENSLSSMYDRMQAPPLRQKGVNDNDNASNTDSDTDNENWNYDIYNCPDDPPIDYPREYKTIDILKHWPPTQNLPDGTYYDHQTNDDGTNRKSKNAPLVAHLGICVFDYRRDFEKIMRYRSEEMPFVVRNDPSVAETVERWNHENYRRKLFGSLGHSNSSAGSDHKIKDSHARDDNIVDEITEMVYHRAERSITNQVLFRHARKKPPKSNFYPSSNNPKIREEKLQGQGQSQNRRQPPPMPPKTKLVAMTYDQWYKHAMEKEYNIRIDHETGIKHYETNLDRNKSLYYYYFRLVGCGEKEGCEQNSTEYLFDEMPFFQPKENIYMVEPDKQRGIHCRFGQAGMIATNHYDASRNAIAILGGSRRYIISKPDQCRNLGLYSVGHPSARHSKVDWTTAFEDYQNMVKHDNENEEDAGILSQTPFNDPDWKDYRASLSLLANNATSTEVVLQAGDVLYLPSYWFHYIISLTTNMQCNTRSGKDGRDDQIMTDCGFPPPIN